MLGAVVASSPDVQLLDSSVADPTVTQVIDGSLDAHFTTFNSVKMGRNAVYWLKVRATETFKPNTLPALAVHTGRSGEIQLYTAGAALTRAVALPEFGGGHEAVFILPPAATAGQSIYVRFNPGVRGFDRLRFSLSTLDAVLAHGSSRARTIALAFGALVAMATASTLMWLVLSEKLFILYGTLFSMQALYVGYLSGQAFEWPLLSYASPLNSFAWNVPAALSGAAACLFVREMADLRRFSPGAYAALGWFAGAFVLLTVANLAKLAGFGMLVNAIGNTLFLGSAVFTLTVAALAWRRGSRAAGWFLVAWILLEAFTIATTARLLLYRDDDRDMLLYHGLPLSMVAAAVLIALGIADRLREQRAALTDAERRAQTDSLTGVLNRRSLIERLEAACARAQARGLPISLLFIDLDHFKEINDSFGHPAGDACLAAVIHPIQAELRQSDVIGRYGGEEFVVILSSADAAAAHPIAERILERVASVRVEGFGEPIQLTCSIGIAASDTLGVWGEKLIARADAAVYVAKRAGRNRVQLAVPLAA
jgi:diguanylate cyclase (GGDEF)-like protein